GRITSSAISLSPSQAGASGTMLLNFTCQHTVPATASIYLELPSTFSSVADSPAIAVITGTDANITASADGFGVVMSLSESTTDIPAGTLVSLQIEGVTNPPHEGPTGTFTVLKTMEIDGETPIDEASTDFNSEDRPVGLYIWPGAFRIEPFVELATYSAGATGAADINFTVSNPLPVDGHIVIEFPPNFTSINATEIEASGIDGGLEVSVAADGYTAIVQRNGSGTVVTTGTTVSVRLLDGITNQQFEGSSGVFPLVKTTLADTNVSIDEASS
ncbi:unnamed protein product, partial [Sphacelaria rigidula]